MAVLFTAYITIPISLILAEMKLPILHPMTMAARI